MVTSLRYVPRGYLDCESALLKIAKTRHPDRWRPELLHEKEAAIYRGLGTLYFADRLGDTLRYNIPEADGKLVERMTERLFDFEDAVYDLREALHAGEIIAEFIDKAGAFGTIAAQGWGGNGALDILLRGEVGLGDIPEDPRPVLFKVEAIENFSNSLNIAQGRKPQVRRGAPQQYDWDEARLFVFRELDTYGDFDRPENRVTGWRSQSDLINSLLQHMGRRRELEAPSESSAKKYVKDWVQEWRSRQSGT